MKFEARSIESESESESESRPTHSSARLPSAAAAAAAEGLAAIKNYQNSSPSKFFSSLTDLCQFPVALLGGVFRSMLTARPFYGAVTTSHGVNLPGRQISDRTTAFPDLPEFPGNGLSSVGMERCAIFQDSLLIGRRSVRLG